MRIFTAFLLLAFLSGCSANNLIIRDNDNPLKKSGKALTRVTFGLITSGASELAVNRQKVYEAEEQTYSAYRSGAMSQDEFQSRMQGYAQDREYIGAQAQSIQQNAQQRQMDNYTECVSYYDEFNYVNPNNPGAVITKCN